MGRPVLAPHAAHAASTGPHVVFVLVDGRLVFLWRLVVGLACVVWLIMLCQQGVRRERDE